ncbi:MarC family protein [Immundisolibacter sp.]|jgi:multiple antibiotic resistance protein|uniref:MarC family protein n=1 Tax=Immundisolibacter sp. TaxID=1934948 RepID=UPI000EE7E75D|nr:MarC family protein [Gammaproteobacteria bacterium]
MLDFDKLLQDSLIIWATIDPIGTLAIFTALTGGMDAAQRRQTAIRAVAYAAAVLLGAIVVGQLILTAMGIRLISFQLSGGIILFLFGLQMIFGSGAANAKKEPGHDIAVFPLAIPATATPGAILAVILLTDNSLHSIPTQAITAAITLAVLGMTLILLLLATPIMRVLGQGGASILTRIMGMILAAFSVELVMNALGVERWLAGLNLSHVLMQ